MSGLKVKVINRSKNNLPTYATVHAAGMDIAAHLEEPITLAPMERRLIPTGLSIALPTGFEAQVRSRSGLALKRGLVVANSPGTIDADYRGEIGVILINLSSNSQTIYPGDRIAQMIVAPYLRVEWSDVDQLDETPRGMGGFGHTGI